ncbi:hypothetical protein [Nocardioides sp. GXQ0305]|uniref:hypothetical protein n=1 Tax=Nocardioides sp. GXQ0305 TaxID=3423912 RepID=UPI003D7EC8E9
MSPHPRGRLLVAAVTAAVLVLFTAPAAYAIDDYAEYQPGTRCAPKAKPGTKVLGRWIVRTQGGSFGHISRPCSRSTSEHEEGRAFDWTLDATRPKHRRIAARFLTRVRATDQAGNTDAKARRMGIMYIIWNDHIYRSYDRREFAEKNYLSSSCRRKRNCSKTLRHRDHMHISLSRAGARGRTSWYDGRVD